ncbi:sigma-70 family RNA polymerase sigma factor [Alysiella filiformis]|uniref:RNA polymerase sigma-70 factor, ECF subfamily n=1 Tax=Alysiella filiformis DSM 16848 TaxID=1120981 RepID=A0A286EGA7_9NEIS|nr:sigma-70 family RNA polymerase sigma factor [Alysiella filiformis]QMT30531.1 sigma-70 family RNA polymerase sigma factor [Alysiella filiformis]UBQ56489.1 sigma-70 family RNA polymerase sigma factor [Alysiella filiformis DSM 16848]SOD69955.1 RNA polymerase sigma-70 factor, ECF subfamily [Alysiella filiformis DSM 16848]
MKKSSETLAPDWAALRQHLLRFAKIQLPDSPDSIEDLVQETLLAAHAKQDSFQAQAQFETWVFGIFKNKIKDFLRGKQRWQAVFVAEQAERDLDDLFAAQFRANGQWQPETEVADWQHNQPDDFLTEKQFLQILQMCLYALPENTARVFMMREILGFDAQEIQHKCGLSSSHYHVLMYRAREHLRQCLQIKWFNTLNEKGKKS